MIALDVPAEDHEIVPAPAVLHGQAAAQRRGEAALLHGVAGGGHLYAAGRGVPGLRGEGEQLPGQVLKLRGLGFRFPHRQYFHRRSRVLAGFQQPVQPGFERKKHVRVGGGVVMIQRQEHPGLRARRAHRRHQPVQRGRGQVEAEEGDVGTAQELRAGGQRHGVVELRLAVLKAPLDEGLVLLLYQRQVLKLHRKKPLGLVGAGPQTLRGQPRLPYQFKLTGAAVRKAPAVLRAPVKPQAVAAFPDGRPHQHHPAALVDAGAVGLARRIEDSPAQALRAQHLQRKGALEIKGFQKRALGLQGQLLGHHDDVRIEAVRHRRAHLIDHGAFQEVAAGGDNLHHAFRFNLSREVVVYESVEFGVLSVELRYKS